MSCVIIAFYGYLLLRLDVEIHLPANVLTMK